VRVLTIVMVVCAVLLGLVSGCSFFGGDKTDYTYWEPELSPDGQVLVYESEADESLELFLRRLETGEEQRLTQNEDPDWAPTWAPSGDRVAFASSRDKNVDIYILDLADLSIARLTTHEKDDINPDWGSDDRIYFNSNRSGAWEIYAIDPDGQSLVKITQAAAPPAS